MSFVLLESASSYQFKQRLQWPQGRAMGIEVEVEQDSPKLLVSSEQNNRLHPIRLVLAHDNSLPFVPTSIP